ncbi:hypothetical protein SNEBB_003447 [Seison nebaliae]|nr:hypothetical protein SNEBB_003447 [Seison nebaliae]
MRLDNSHDLPLMNVPIGVKDNFCLKNHLTTCASQTLSNWTSPYNCEVVERIFQNGGHIVQKENMDEFGMGSTNMNSFYGRCVNGFNSLKSSNRVAGGSSGGSAVSIATNMTLISIGSDTGGSIRNPSSMNGVVGFKPSYGRISRYGLIPLNNALDTVSITSSSIPLVALMYNLVNGEDEKDLTTVPGKTEIVLNKNFDLNKIKFGTIDLSRYFPIEQNENWEMLKKKLNVKTLEENVIIGNSSLIYECLTSCEITSNMARFDGIRYGHRNKISLNEIESRMRYGKISDKLNHSIDYMETRNESFGNEVQQRIINGNYFLHKKNYHKYFQSAMNCRESIRKEMERLLNGIDVLVWPTLPFASPKFHEITKKKLSHLEMAEGVLLTTANLANLPAISIPWELNDDDMPIGLHLSSHRYNEQLLLDVAHKLEGEFSFNEKKNDLGDRRKSLLI